MAIEYRWAEGQYDRLPAIGGRFGRGVSGRDRRKSHTPAALAAKAATATIPIVFASPEIRSNSVLSPASPGRAATLTGVNFLLSEVGAKRMELLRELVPAAAHFGVLVNPAIAECRGHSGDLQGGGCRHRGADGRRSRRATNREIDAAFGTLIRNKADALVVGTDPFFTAGGSSSPR